MRLLSLVVLFSLWLSACDRGKNSPSSEIGGAEPDKPQSAAPFEPFLMKSKVDCAGYRRAFNYLYSRSFVEGDSGVVLKLHLAEDGSYRILYEEFMDGHPFADLKGIYTGSWKVNEGRLVLTGTAQGNFERLGTSDRVKGELKIPGTRFLAQSRTFNLVSRFEGNDSGIVDCAPGENPDIKKVGDEFEIGGRPALKFWAGRLGFVFDDDKLSHANIGEWSDSTAGGVIHRVLVRVYANGTFTLLKQIEEKGHRQIQAETGGTWKMIDGLVALGELGVIVPSRGALLPVLYLKQIPGVKAELREKLKVVVIDRIGL